MANSCAVAGTCGGCPWIGRPYADQLEAKRAHLRGLWREAGLPDPGELPIASAGEDGLRDRADLAFRRAGGAPVLGLWDLAGERIVDVGDCPAATPALRAFLATLRADPPPIDRASLRLRVAPDGRRGLWIDAANADIKALLDEGAWLRRRLADAVVEMGQRRKPLVDEDRLRLSKDHALLPWFQTWIGDRPVPLYGPVGGFTQPGHAINRLLVGRVAAMAAATGARRWLELGAGHGNFTLPLAADGHVVALEIDPLAREGLARAAAEAGLADRVEILAGDAHRAAGMGPLVDEAEAVLADPPRSGLRGFVDALAERTARPAIVYVSCHAETLVADAARLAALGYRAARLEGVDQFPQSPHGEWLSWFRR